MTVDALPSILERVLAKRVAPGRPVVIKLVGDPTLFRVEPTAGIARLKLALKSLNGRARPFRSIGRLGRLLGQAIDQSDLAGNHRDTPRALLPFLAVVAADWTARLADQLGARPALSIRREPLPVGFQREYKSCLRDVQRAQRVAGRIAKALIETMRLPPPECSRRDEARILRLQSERGGVRATWLDAEGNELGRETFRQMVRRACSSPPVVQLAEEAAALRDRQQAHRAAGEAQLESVCPQLLQTLRSALAKKRCVGHWICSTELRGLPAEVYLYLDAVTRGRRYPRASLVARRAHEEFLLENAEKTLFYFPPIQLVARIDFTAASPPWHVARPMVRMPRSHPAWRHPYTGNLRVDPFSRAELLGACGREAIVPASREARRLFPDLVRKTSRRDAQEKDLCLYGQERAVGQLIDRTCGRSWRRREVDVLTLVQGLWDLARVGLTRAHQVNGHMPRSTLGCGSMLYPLPSRDALANTRLARRVFPYNPWVPSG